MYMNSAKTTPKDFFLWAGAMISLFGSIGAFIGLVFDYINYVFPDPLAYYASNPYESGVAYEMSSFLILGALCLILIRVIHNTIQKDPTRADIWVRRWALFLTLFIAGAAIAVDLIVLLTSFLNGEELTVRFLLKVALVLLVAGTGFMHFLADLWGYWTKNPKLSLRVSIGVGVLGIVTIAAGFVILGTPYHARQVRLDENRISDLQNIQYQIVSYWQTKQMLPQSLTELNDSISGFSVPADPQTNMPYEYQTTGTYGFKLCATFTANGQDRYGSRPQAVPYGVDAQDNWAHDAGHVCFDRTIDPTRYPPTNQPAKAIPAQ